jgi:hypothetical protein
MPLIALPFVAMAGIGAAGSIASAAIGSHAAGSAAQTQADAATQAAQIQAQSAREALDFQKQQFQTQQNNLAPFLNVGRGGLANLAYLMGINTDGMTIPGTGTPGTPDRTMPGRWESADATGHSQLRKPMMGEGQDGNYVPGETIPGTPGTPDTSLSSLVNKDNGAFGSLTKGFDEKFVAPTGATEENDPGYQFRLNEGLKALERSASARGDLLNGGTAKAEQQFGQDYASNEYGNVYSRAMNEYLNRFNIFNSNNTNTFNRFSTLAGGGQVAANSINAAGQNFANNASTLTMESGNAQAQGINNAGAARASGYVGGANAWSGALGGLGGNLSQLALLNSIYNKQPTAVPPTAVDPWGVA